jgi:hypothetical protein
MIDSAASSSLIQLTQDVLIKFEKPPSTGATHEVWTGGCCPWNELQALEFTVISIPQRKKLSK